ncbi:hypothetical protein [Frankia tisae]|uniref:hypothetical protein n=1 Tax=Frankia tisae TaxID=2950104 RepID=UPI0021C1CC79|nr:hypothetical protein [Frankia tisae]
MAAHRRIVGECAGRDNDGQRWLPDDVAGAVTDEEDSAVGFAMLESTVTYSGAAITQQNQLDT